MVHVNWAVSAIAASTSFVWRWLKLHCDYGWCGKYHYLLNIFIFMYMQCIYLIELNLIWAESCLTIDSGRTTLCLSCWYYHPGLHPACTNREFKLLVQTLEKIVILISQAMYSGCLYPSWVLHICLTSLLFSLLGQAKFAVFQNSCEHSRRIQGGVSWL